MPQGHEHAEDILRDPDVMQWMDRYAERMEELTESEWRQRIENPASRWYKNGEEYKLLFRFANTAPPPGGGTASRREDVSAQRIPVRR